MNSGWKHALKYTDEEREADFLRQQIPDKTFILLSIYCTSKP